MQYHISVRYATLCCAVLTITAATTCHQVTLLQDHGLYFLCWTGAFYMLVTWQAISEEGKNKALLDRQEVESEWCGVEKLTGTYKLEGQGHKTKGQNVRL